MSVKHAETFKRVGKSFKGYAAIWMEYGKEVCICTPTRSELKSVWQRITSTELKPGTQRVKISRWKKP